MQPWELFCATEWGVDSDFQGGSILLIFTATHLESRLVPFLPLRHLDWFACFRKG
jgi:hypothetical protein